MPHFLFLCNILSFGSSGLNCEFICKEYGFLINSKISLMSSGDKPNSVRNFHRLRYLPNLDLLGETNFKGVT